MNTPTLTYDDHRSGDTYVIYLTPTLSFLAADRYVDRIGSEPITYESLSEIPQPHRHAIENLLHKPRK